MILTPHSLAALVDSKTMDISEPAYMATMPEDRKRVHRFLMLIEGMLKAGNELHVMNNDTLKIILRGD
jgi:hypothetical protein